jgi:hypothetical protein
LLVRCGHPPRISYFLCGAFGVGALSMPSIPEERPLDFWTHDVTAVRGKLGEIRQSL